jgi:hypothetical protein
MVSGPGITNHQYPVSGSYRNSISDGGSFGTPQETPEDQQPLGGGPQSNQAPGSFAVSFSEGYQQTTLAFEGNAVMLRVDHVPLLVNQLLSLVAVDDQDREVEVMQKELRESNFWFFNVAPDAKSIKIRALLQESETVEFFVKPPAVPKPLEEQ